MSHPETTSPDPAVPNQMVAAACAELIRVRAATLRRPMVVAVGGPGGCGKSSLTAQLAALLDDAAVLRLDDYKTPRRERAERKLYGPHPDANHMALIHEHIREIRAGQPFEQPIYCRVQGTAATWRAYHPQAINLLDGEVATYPDFAELVDLSIYIDAHWRTQLNTRLERDIEQRGYSVEKAIDTFLNSNLREFATFGAASSETADILLFCDEQYQLTVIRPLADG
jgi:uridine kinase